MLGSPLILKLMSPLGIHKTIWLVAHERMQKVLYLTATSMKKLRFGENRKLVNVFPYKGVGYFLI